MVKAADYFLNANRQVAEVDSPQTKAADDRGVDGMGPGQQLDKDQLTARTSEAKEDVQEVMGKLDGAKKEEFEAVRDEVAAAGATLRKEPQPEMDELGNLPSQSSPDHEWKGINNPAAERWASQSVEQNDKDKSIEPEREG